MFMEAIIYNFNKMQSEEEEGFIEDLQTELVDFDYQPSFRLWTSQEKPSIGYKKKQILECHRLINSSIRKEWIKNVQQVIPKTVVFNNVVRRDVSYFQFNLTFTSDFQSGNLDLVSRDDNNSYSLYMRPDTNTRSHFQWFYFRLKIRKGNRKVKFTLKNFIKSTMLYSKGLKPYCRALKNPDYHQFKQITGPVKFFQGDEHFNLQFTYHFQHDDDQVQFSSQPPYTFQHLEKFVTNIKCKKLTLGKTVLGKKIPYLLFEAKKQLKVIVIVIARQHPGEAVGSWMMEGFVNCLQNNHYDDYITWVVVPMLNIDGVILGNNRTGVLGHDFNRNWVAQNENRSSKLFPENSAVVNLVRSLKKKHPRKVKMFLDLHGHSSQPNVFTYGPPHEEKSQYFYQSRLFPQLLTKKNQNFNLNQCSYVLKPSKKNTARSIIFFNLGIPFTYTIESTFGIMRGNPVSTDDFLKMGEDIASATHEFMFITRIKEVSETKGIMEQLKMKYADAKNGGEEYESASEESDEDPDRVEIEEIVLGNIFQSPLKPEVKKMRYEKTEKWSTPLENKYSVQKSKIEINHDKNYFSVEKRRYLQKKQKLKTQGELILKKKQCILPAIKKKNPKQSFQQSFFTDEELKLNLKMEDIQKRLYKMRNSKIGKKILVINAYGV